MICTSTRCDLYRAYLYTDINLLWILFSDLGQSHTRISRSNDQKLCRICCQRLQRLKERRTFSPLCSRYVRDILIYFKKDVQNDGPMYSKHIGRKCLSRIYNLKTLFLGLDAFQSAKELAKEYNSVWCVYSSSVSSQDCSVCRHYENIANCMEQVLTSNWHKASTSYWSDEPVQISSEIPPYSFLADLLSIPPQPEPVQEYIVHAIYLIHITYLWLLFFHKWTMPRTVYQNAPFSTVHINTYEINERNHDACTSLIKHALSTPSPRKKRKIVMRDSSTSPIHKWTSPFKSRSQ